LKPVAIRISFDDDQLLQRWLEVVQQSRKTDKQLIDLLEKKQLQDEEAKKNDVIRKSASAVEFKPVPVNR
jgi:hypothetical protein